MQSPRTKPRKSTVGTLYAVGGMDNNKGIIGYLLLYELCFTFSLSENGEITFYSKISGECLNQSRNVAKTSGPMKIC